MPLGRHHIHKRKRIHKKLEKYPHPNKYVKFLDNFLLIIALIGPLMNLPQMIKIFTFKTSAGVSTLSFTLFAIFDIPWIVYGIVHKEKPIVLAYTLWLITNAAVVVGTFIYP